MPGYVGKITLDDIGNVLKGYDNCEKRTDDPFLLYGNGVL